jgi:cytochrome c oxidase subunit 2
MGISEVLWQYLVKWLNNSALFPREASTIAPYMDQLYLFLVGMTVTGLVLVLVLVFGFSLRYRKPVHPVAEQIEGSTLLEATWTIIPLGIFLVSFVWGALLYFRIYTPPVNSMNVYIVGKQWMWKAEHPGGQHEINELHVPTGRPIQLTLISQDVFHSYSLPEFRVKREVPISPVSMARRSSWPTARPNSRMRRSFAIPSSIRHRMCRRVMHPLCPRIRGRSVRTA